MDGSESTYFALVIGPVHVSSSNSVSGREGSTHFPLVWEDTPDGAGWSVSARSNAGKDLVNGQVGTLVGAKSDQY